MLDTHTGVIVFLVGLEILYWIVLSLSKKFKMLKFILYFFNFFKVNKRHRHKSKVIKDEEVGFELIDIRNTFGTGLDDDVIYSPSYSCLPGNKIGRAHV